MPRVPRLAQQGRPRQQARTLPPHRLPGTRPGLARFPGTRRCDHICCKDLDSKTSGVRDWVGLGWGGVMDGGGARRWKSCDWAESAQGRGQNEGRGQKWGRAAIRQGQGRGRGHGKGRSQKWGRVIGQSSRGAGPS